MAQGAGEGLRSLNILVAGSKEVGKSAFIARFRDDDEAMEPEHDADAMDESSVASSEKSVHDAPHVRVITNRGPVIISFFEASWPEVEVMPPDWSADLPDIDGAIMMYDVTRRVSYKLVPTVYRDIITAFDHLPIALVGNKVDVRDRKVKPKMITFHRKKNLPYYDISTRVNYNIEKPLLWLMRKVFADAELAIEEIPIAPVTASDFDPAALGLYDPAIHEAMPLPDDDDDL